MKNTEITPKQKEVLQLIAQGFSSEEIAKELGNSKKTIDAIRAEMLTRFQAHNTAHLVAIGFKKRWLK